MAETENGYIHYQNMIAAVSTALSDMEKLCDQMKLEENRRDMEKLQQKLSSRTFSVGVMGEFKRGKSTVINSLLEQEIMPADILPCSATMNRVTYDLRPHVRLKLRDGSSKDIAVEELAAYVTKLTSENESRAAEVDEAVVYYPCRFCRNGVDIVDTPGLNDDERMNRISEEVIPKLDAVIMVLTPDNPFSMSEAEFVRNKLMASDLSRLIFVVNKIDMVRRAADRQRVVDGIRDKICRSVMDKMAAVYGADSPEYREAVKKLGRIRVYPLSALDALDGKTEGDQQLIEKSGTLEFEAALTRMLTEDRGALELSGALNALTRTASELEKTVALRKSALEMNAQEFARSQQEALREISGIREEKQRERKRLQESANAVKEELRQEIADFYPTLQDSLQRVLDEAVSGIDPRQLESNQGLEVVAQQLQSAVNTACQDELSVFSERLRHKLETRVGQELAETGAFVSSVSQRLDQMNGSLFTGKSGLTGGDILAAGLQYMLGMGLGGIYTGYRNAGVKGALVGGGLSVGAAVSVAVILAEMALAGPAALLIAALAGTAAGKFGTAFLFRRDIGQRKLEQMRATVRENITAAVSELRTGRELENWADEQVRQRFDELIAGLEAETERLLKSTEASMDEIKHDITENELQRKQLSDRFDGISRSARRILEEDLAPVARRVREALEEREEEEG